MPVTKRLRIFAGPNGSGKSTIVGVVDKLVGCPYFVNADEIYAKLSQKGHLSFDDYLVVLDVETFREQFRRSGFFPKSAHAEELIDGIRKTGDNMLTVPDKAVDSYFAAFVADFLRDNMLNVVQQFTIETVMSDPRKADYIRTAKRLGYRIYLYFVSRMWRSISPASRSAYSSADTMSRRKRSKNDIYVLWRISSRC